MRTLRALLLAEALLLPAAAHADPVTIIAAVVEVLGTVVGGLTVANWLAVAALAYQVYGASAARRSARRDAANQRARYNAEVQDRSVTVLQATPPWRIVYGECVTGGDIVAIFTSDKAGRRGDGTAYTRPDALKHLVVHIASHECYAIDEVYIDGVPLGALDGSGYVTTGEFATARTVSEEVVIGSGASATFPSAVTVLQIGANVASGLVGDFTWTAGTYSLSGAGTILTNTSGFTATVSVTYSLGGQDIRIQKHLGSASQTVDTYLNGLFPVEWDSSHRLRGICYAVVTLDLENPRFAGGPPTGLTFGVRGRLAYDPRTATTVYTQNNAVLTRDFLTAPWGPGAVSADVNTTFHNAAANACDAAATFMDWNTVAYGESWDVAGNLQGWLGSGATLTATDGYMVITSTGSDPVAYRGGLAIAGSANTAVRARIKRVAGSGWQGTCYYITGGHGRSASYRKDIAQPTYDPVTGWAEVTFDMAALTAGGTDWTTNTITEIQLDFGTTSADVFHVDWVAIGPMTQPTYTCNGVFTTDMGREGVLEDLCESMMGTAVYGSDWRISAGVWTASVMDLTDDDLDGMIELVQGDTPIDQLANGVRGTIIAKGESSNTEFDSYQNASYLAADGEPLWFNLALPFTESKARARNLARIYLERGRSGQIFKYPGKLRTWRLQVGDRIRLTNTEYALSLAYYRVTDKAWSPTSPVALTLEKDAAASYDLADAALKDMAPNTGLANPWLVAAITGLGAASGTAQMVRQTDGTLKPRVSVTWNAVTDPYIADGRGQIFVEWRIIGRDAANSIRTETLPGTEVGCYLVGATDGDLLVIGIYARNGLGAVGPRAYIVHTVVGAYSYNFNGRSGNLIDTAWWAPGVAATRWPVNDAGAGLATNSFVVTTLPDGSSGVVMQALYGSGGGPAGGWEGGATDVSGRFPVNKDKAYMFACFQKGVSGDGSEYWGIESSTVCALNTTTPDSNPYFSSLAKNNTDWYLHVGWVYPYGTTGHATGKAGTYNCTTGALVSSGSCFNWNDVASASTRAYQYYSTVAASKLNFVWPQVWMCDGSEPSVDDLLSMVVPTERLATNAATDPIQLAYSASGSVIDSGTPGAIPTSTDVNTLTWLNDSGDAVQVEITHSINMLATSTGATSTHWALYSHTLSDFSASQISELGTRPQTTEGWRANSQSFVFTVPDGVTLTVVLSVTAFLLTGAGSATTTWGEASTRITPVKK